jgi:hypothetical protein
MEDASAEPHQEVRTLGLEGVDLVTYRHPRPLTNEAKQLIRRALEDSLPMLRKRGIPVLVLEPGASIELHRSVDETERAVKLFGEVVGAPVRRDGTVADIYVRMATAILGKRWSNRFDLAAHILAGDPWITTSVDPVEVWERARPSDRERVLRWADGLIRAGWRKSGAPPREEAVDDALLAELQAIRALLEDEAAARREGYA